MSDNTCYTENYRSSCELVGTGGALSERGYMKTDSNEIVEIEPNVQQYECDKFWTTLDDNTPNSSSSFLSYKYLGDPRAGSGSYYNNDGDESNRKLAVKCMARGGGGGTSATGGSNGCMSPLNYFNEIPETPDNPQERIQTWEQLFTSMKEQFLDPNICQRTESIGPTNENSVMICRQDICEDGMVLKSNPTLEIGQSPTSDLCCSPADATTNPADGSGAGGNPNPDTTNSGQGTGRVAEEVTLDNTCHIGHILQIVTDINSQTSDTKKQISNTCSNGDTLNSGETCYLYCNSFESAGPTPTTEELDKARIGTEDNPSKSSRISCGTVSTGQELNCAPDDSRTTGDICPHTHHIYLKCSEDSEEIEIDFEIDAQTATAGGLVTTALAIAGYLIFL